MAGISYSYPPITWVGSGSFGGSAKSNSSGTSTGKTSAVSYAPAPAPAPLPQTVQMPGFVDVVGIRPITGNGMTFPGFPSDSSPSSGHRLTVMPWTGNGGAIQGLPTLPSENDRAFRKVFARVQELLGRPSGAAPEQGNSTNYDWLKGLSSPAVNPWGA